jgi:hypothetical protein
LAAALDRYVIEHRDQLNFIEEDEDEPDEVVVVDRRVSSNKLYDEAMNPSSSIGFDKLQIKDPGAPNVRNPKKFN